MKLYLDIFSNFHYDSDHIDIREKSGHNMYKERMFTNWKIGLLHLAIAVGMPILPIIIYLRTEGSDKAYLYVLILTVVASFLYSYMNPPYSDCGKFLKVEDFLCSMVLILMLLGSLFFLLLSFTVEDGLSSVIDVALWSKILVAPFSVPIITTVIEIIRCFVNDFQSSGYSPDDENIVRGAADV